MDLDEVLKALNCPSRDRSENLNKDLSKGSSSDPNKGTDKTLNKDTIMDPIKTAYTDLNKDLTIDPNTIETTLMETSVPLEPANHTQSSILAKISNLREEATKGPAQYKIKRIIGDIWTYIWSSSQKELKENPASLTKYALRSRELTIEIRTKHTWDLIKTLWDPSDNSPVNKIANGEGHSHPELHNNI